MLQRFHYSIRIEKEVYYFKEVSKVGFGGDTPFNLQMIVSKQ